MNFVTEAIDTKMPSPVDSLLLNRGSDSQGRVVQDSVGITFNRGQWAQQPLQNALRGAWLLAEVVEGPGSPNVSPLPSLLIFTDRHYSAMAVTAARPKFAPAQATDAEKLAD